jgi:putative peptidoglycan lipid II flippase
VSESPKPSRSLAGIAGIVAIATLISKLFGLFREQAIAAAFGVGAVVNAYAYAYVVPGFLFVLLGGINGPFHSALVSVLAKKEREEAAPLVETITTYVSLILFLVTIGLMIFAQPIIGLLAPGLKEPQVIANAVLQLRIMAPLALLSGLIGIGFGTLNASDRYWLPSISPLFSSLAAIIGVGVLFWYLGDSINAPRYMTLGGVVLAGGTLAGGIWQWLAQLGEQSKAGMGKFRLRFDWHIPGVTDVLKVMGPATLSSGMLYINVYTNLFFASFIENAAAAMRYANFIVLTPLGIISNAILVPMLPVFSRLTDPQDWPELKARIRQGLLLSALTMLPLTAIFVSLSVPIIRIVYERYAFKASDSTMVASLLIAYGLGTFFYLGRDVLVRVFYALGDGDTPFRVSLFNIFLNAFLDFLWWKPFGAPGIVYATVAVNFTSMMTFIWILHRRLQGLPLLEWGLSIVSLSLASVVAGFASWWTNKFLVGFLGDRGFIVLAIELIVASTVAVAIFTLAAVLLKVPEMKLLVSRLRQKLGK